MRLWRRRSGSPEPGARSREGIGCSWLLTLGFWLLLLHAQTFAPGPQVVTFLSDVDTSDQPYGLYVPKGYDAGRKYPLVISLHGAGSNHRLNLRRVFGKSNLPGETDTEATRFFPVLKDVDFIVASPLARGTMGYQGIAEKDVYDVLADVRRRFSIDEDRMYLTGLSMGGGGTLWLGLTRPDIWAAIAPVCPAVPPEAAELVGNALGMPVHLFQGEIDPIVPAAGTREWHKRLLDAGAKAVYKEYPNVRHNSWEAAYRDASIFEWFSQFRRDRFPARVHFSARQYRHGSAYWVRFVRMNPGRLATIDAAFTAPNQLRIALVENLNAFTLTLEGHPQFRAALPLMIQIGGVTLRVRGKGLVTLVNREGRWSEQPSYKPAPEEKALNREGPMLEAVASQHLYVYGTKDSPSQEELLHRQDVAQKAADWSTPAARLSLALRVVADVQVKETDRASGNLILFGTPETNSVIASLPAAPLVLNPSAADYGLVYVQPTLGGHYALVNSGLPWWTGADHTPRAGLNFLPLQVGLLQSFPDYIVFRGSLSNMITEGYFDEKWRLPASARAALEESGAVRF